MLFSVVIPTCQRNDLLAQCLQRLAPGVQHLSSQDYEVIVTDDGTLSTAESLIREGFPWVRWYPGPRRGPAANRNSGASHARGEWLVFVDDDCLPEKGWLNAFRGGLENTPDCAVWEGRTYPDRPRRSLAEACPANETGGVLWSCNFAVRKSLFDSMGGFDAGFPFACMEDVDFRDRLTNRGEQFIFLPEAAVCHPWRPRKIRQELKQHEASVNIYLSRYPERRENFRASYYTSIVARGLLRDTLPAMWRYRGAGLSCALREHLGYLGIAFKIISRRTYCATSNPSGA